MKLLQQEVVQLPLALCFLVLQQRAILTGPPTYSEHSPETWGQLLTVQEDVSAIINTGEVTYCVQQLHLGHFKYLNAHIFWHLFLGSAAVSVFTW